MKLRRLILRNFQKHIKLVLPLSPRITSIVGATDSGKSAVLRALRWVCLNDIPGGEFVRDGSKECRVSLKLCHKKEEHKLLRARNPRGNDNRYVLDDQPFRSFGQGQPEDVQKLLRLSELNFQGQHDAPFWFSLSAGEVSRQLNAVVDLSIIDSSLSNITSRVRQTQERVSFLEEEQNSIQQKQGEMKKQLLRAKEFDALLLLRQQEQDLRNKTRNLGETLSTLREKEQIHHTKKEQADGAGEVVRRMKEVQELRAQSAQLEGLLQRSGDLSTKTNPPSLSKVETLQTQRLQTLESLRTLRRAVTQAKEAEEDYQEKLRRAEQAEKQYHTQTKGSLCPVCGKQI